MGENHSESFEALSLDNYCPVPQTVINVANYTRSKSNLDQVYSSRNHKVDRENVLPSNRQKGQSLQKSNLLKQNNKDGGNDRTYKNNIIKHSASEANINRGSTTAVGPRSRKNSFTKPIRQSNVFNNNSSKIPLNSARVEKAIIKPIPIITATPVELYVSPKVSPDSSLQDDDFVPVYISRPIGLDLDEFLPVSIYFSHNPLCRECSNLTSAR